MAFKIPDLIHFMEKNSGLYAVYPGQQNILQEFTWISIYVKLNRFLIPIVW